MKKQKLAIILTTLALIFIYASVSYSAEIAGQVLIVKNNAYRIRNNAKDNAKPQMGLLLQDAVETEKKSRTKLFFKDDSILNLGELSRVEVEEYLFDSEKNRSKSIYRLIDGAMKVVVGRSDLEVHTSTAVAAARGTIFIIWNEKSDISAENITSDNNNLLVSKDMSGIYLVVNENKPRDKKRSQPGSCVYVIKGKVEIKNANRNIKEKKTADSGDTVCVPAGGPPEFRADKRKDAPKLYVLGPFKEDKTELPAFAPEPAFEDTDIPIYPPVPQEPDVEGGKQGDFERID